MPQPPLLLLCSSACAGEGSGSANASGAAGGGDQNTVTIDYATYNPLSLIIRKKGWLETALAAEGKKVEWVKVGRFEQGE